MSVLAPDIGWHCCAPDMSLSYEGSKLRDLLETVSSPPPGIIGRHALALDRLMSALADASVSLSPVTLTRTLDLMNALPADAPLPEIVVESGTQIGLDWDESPRRTLSLTVDESPRVGYSSLIGRDSHYGKLEFASGARRIPKTLDQLFTDLYPLWR